MRPLTLLIAEDEKVERQALRLLISRAHPEIIIMDDALNGIDLVHKALEKDPDIIITDIEMPGLSGLEAICKIKQKGYAGKIIVQTAYNQFDYAREALNLDAEAYLLKPIKKEKIISVLNEVKELVYQEHEEQDEKQRSLQILASMKPLIDSDIISSIQFNEIQSAFLKSYLRQRNIPQTTLSIMTIRMAPPNGDISNFHSHQGNETISDKIRLLFESDSPLIVGQVVSNRISILIGNSLKDPYKIRLETIRIAEKIREAILKEQLHSNEVQTGIGRPIESIKDLPLSYKESLIVLKANLSGSNIQHYGDLNPDEKNPLPTISREVNLLECILHSDVSKVEQLMETYFQNQIISHLKLPELTDVLLSSLVEIYQQISILLPEHPQQMEALSVYLQKLVLCHSPEKAINWFKNEIVTLAIDYNNQSQKRIHKCVQNARNYIEKNYMRNISLDIVAEEIGVSPYHLSHLFKQELDQNYIKYLTNLRIRKAEELMKKGRYTLSELSGLTGYNNISYFTRVFKKNTGKNLKEVNGFSQIMAQE